MKTIMNQAYMARMAQLMTQALESPEGMRALAAAIAAPIEQEIARKEISSLLLVQHTLPKGERPLYQKKPRVKAYWISTEGEIREQQLGQDEVEFGTNRIHSNPMVDVSILKNGNIGTLMDIQQASADEIRKEIDKRTINVISSAVPSVNTIEVAGGGTGAYHRTAHHHQSEWDSGDYLRYQSDRCHRWRGIRIARPCACDGTGIIALYLEGSD